jgi:hypothetical protein
MMPLKGILYQHVVTLWLNMVIRLAAHLQTMNRPLIWSKARVWQMYYCLPHASLKLPRGARNASSGAKRELELVQPDLSLQVGTITLVHLFGLLTVWQAVIPVLVMKECDTALHVICPITNCVEAMWPLHRYHKERKGEDEKEEEEEERNQDYDENKTKVGERKTPWWRLRENFWL